MNWRHAAPGIPELRGQAADGRLAAEQAEHESWTDKERLKAT
jgi:hypothetical protein